VGSVSLELYWATEEVENWGAPCTPTLTGRMLGEREGMVEEREGMVEEREGRVEEREEDKVERGEWREEERAREGRRERRAHMAPRLSENSLKEG